MTRAAPRGQQAGGAQQQSRDRPAHRRHHAMVAGGGRSTSCRSDYCARLAGGLGPQRRFRWLTRWRRAFSPLEPAPPPLTAKPRLECDYETPELGSVDDRRRRRSAHCRGRDRATGSRKHCYRRDCLPIDPRWSFPHHSIGTRRLGDDARTGRGRGVRRTPTQLSSRGSLRRLHRWRGWWAPRVTRARMPFPRALSPR
jgi:hypothetical protein